ncbi:molybdopterin synthase small subunit CnxG [Terfezia claveryi]|nr:molybdopterin synthase small subunit CnxG [Terfezia claveryi]
MSTFTILYFAACASYTSRSYEVLPAPLPISKLFYVLEEKYAGITENVLGSCHVTVNFKYVDITGGDRHDMIEGEVVIQDGDEVAIIPPVSSG